MIKMLDMGKDVLERWPGDIVLWDRKEYGWGCIYGQRSRAREIGEQFTTSTLSFEESDRVNCCGLERWKWNKHCEEECKTGNIKKHNHTWEKELPSGTEGPAGLE